jgi:calcium-dependent protein kinase
MFGQCYSASSKTSEASMKVMRTLAPQDEQPLVARKLPKENMPPNRSVPSAAEIPKVSLLKIQGCSSNAAVSLSRYHHRDFAEDYQIFPEKVLGKGCSGNVILATNRASGRNCALKRIEKRSLAPNILEQLITEVEICLSLDHPNVVRLDDVYDSEHEIALFMEYLEGGELFGRLTTLGVFPESLAVETSRQMLRSVGYLHSHNFVHRDLKLENFVYENNTCSSQLKVIDFGFAKVWDSSQPYMRTSCGSIAYVSPDVLCGHGYTSKCDLWSVGVIIFMLLSGYPPFHGSDHKMTTSIASANVDWSHKQRWAKVSEDAISFVKSLLTRDPSKRMDAQAALKHPWLLGAAASKTAMLSAAAVRSIDNYVGAPSLRRAMLQLVAREVAPQDVADLRRTFLELAGDEEGTVRLSELKAAIRGDQSSVQPTDSDPKTPARKLRKAKTEKLKELFQVMDVNGDNQVYYSDFLAATMHEELKLREEYVWAAFHRLDADNSGAISADDIQSSIGETFEGVATHLLMQGAGWSPSAQGEMNFESFMRVLGRSNWQNDEDNYIVDM